MTYARAAASGLVLSLAVLATGCGTIPTPPQSPSPSVSTPTTTSPTPEESPSPTPPGERTVTQANLLTAKDIPKSPLGGKVEAYETKARPVGQVSVCEQDLAELKATATVHGSYRQVAADMPKTPLTGRPNVYVIAFQFADASKAVQASQTWKSWVDTCRDDIPARTGFTAVDRGFRWQSVSVPAPAQSDVTQITYVPKGSKSDSNYWESTGLTVVDDRMMVTVHLFYAEESLYNMDPYADEGGSPHPQRQLTKAAAKRLAS